MTFDPALFASTFALIFVAELPDKTALATVLMAARRHPIAVFVGAAGAFAVQSAVAVIFGGFLLFCLYKWFFDGAYFVNNFDSKLYMQFRDGFFQYGTPSITITMGLGGQSMMT